jgi:hypothetical protein
MLKTVISKVNNHRATNPLGDKAASQTRLAPGAGEEFSIRLKPFHGKAFERLAAVKQAERERPAALFSALFSRSDAAWRSANGCWRREVGWPSRSARDGRGIFRRARPSWKVLILTVFN